MGGAVMSFSAAQWIVKRVYSDLSNPATLAVVGRDYELIRKAAASGTPYLTSARDHLAQRLKQADATGGA